MSTEQAEAQTENQPAAETNDNTQTENTEQKEGGFAPRVDLSELPDDIRGPVEARFKHLSGLMKRRDEEAERKNNEWRSIAEQQSKQIEELMNGTSQIASYLHNQNTEATEDQLRKEARTAFESGDLDKYQTAQDRLLDIKARKAAQALQPKQTQQKQPQRNVYDGPNSSSQFAQDAALDGDVAQEAVQFVAAYQSETDDAGNPIRPWAFNTSKTARPDPDFIKAHLIADELFETNPVDKFASVYEQQKVIQQNLAELDKRMGVRKSMPKQNVLGGSFTSPGKNNRIALTPQQERIAIKMKIGARGGAKTDEDFKAAYRKQLEQAKKGRR